MGDSDWPSREATSADHAVVNVCNTRVAGRIGVDVTHYWASGLVRFRSVFVLASYTSKYEL